MVPDSVRRSPHAPAGALPGFSDAAGRLRSAVTGLDRCDPSHRHPQRLVDVVSPAGGHSSWAVVGQVLSLKHTFLSLTSPSASALRSIRMRQTLLLCREIHQTSRALCTRAMENLANPTIAGPSVFDLNSEHLDRKDW